MNTDIALKIINMCQACAIWAAIFLVFYFITKCVGMTNNLPRETKKRLEDLSRFNDNFIEKITDDKEDSEKEIIRFFKRLKRLQRTAQKVYAVYVYDHPLNVDAPKVATTLEKMQDEYLSISVSIKRHQFADIEKNLKQITAYIATAKKQLEKVITKDEEERILHA